MSERTLVLSTAKRILLLITLTALFPAVSMAEDETDVVFEEAPQSSPHIEVIPTEVDFGTVSNDTPASASIAIRNTGDAALVISAVKATCGCTVVDEVAATLAPGDETTVGITVDPNRIPAFSFTRAVVISSNDPAEPVKLVPLKGVIEPEFTVEPQELDISQCEKGKTKEWSLGFRSLGGSAVELTDLDVSGISSHFNASLEELPVEEWHSVDEPEYRVILQLLEGAPAGSFHKNLELLTTCKRVPRYKVCLRGEVVSFYRVTPNAAALAICSPGSSFEKVITVVGERPIVLSSTGSTSEALAVSARESENPETWFVDVRVSPDAKPEVLQGAITFSVSDGENTATESISVRGIIREGA